jgi:hypothetical protein
MKQSMTGTATTKSAIKAWSGRSRYFRSLRENCRAASSPPEHYVKYMPELPDFRGDRVTFPEGWGSPSDRGVWELTIFANLSIQWHSASRFLLWGGGRRRDKNITGKLNARNQPDWIKDDQPSTAFT